MADYTKAAHLCYVTMSIEHPLVKEHIRAGGRAVVVRSFGRMPFGLGLGGGALWVGTRG